MLNNHHLIDPNRFWRTVDITAGPDQCWPWMGALNSGGYGEFTKRVGSSRSPHSQVYRWRAHRVAYELAIGPIPDGLVIDHLCRVRNCVNPSHLEPVTQRVNVRRGDASRSQNLAHCPHGHPFDDANTYVSSNGWRYCRTCRRQAQRRAAQRKQAAQQVRQ